MLVVSAPLFAYYTNAVNNFSVPTDPFLKLFNPTAKQDYQNLQSAQLVSLVFVVGGFVSLGCGIVVKNRHSRPFF
jgi:hypothetical protein